MSNSRLVIAGMCAVACGGGSGQSVVELEAAKNTDVALEAPAVDGADDYAWAFEASPARSAERLFTNGAEASLRADASGTFEVVRTARDGDTVLDAVRFIVTVTNDAPVVVIDAEFATTTVAGRLSAERTTDANGDSLTYSWEIVQAPAGATAALADPTADRTALETDTAGLYEVAVEVDDGDGGVTTTSRTLRVHGPAFAPIPGAGFSFFNPIAVYSPSHRQIILAGAALHIVDVDTGTLSLDGSFAGYPIDISPDGEIVWLRQGNRTFAAYRLATREVLRTRNILAAASARLVGASDALYWVTSSTGGNDLSAWFWQPDAIVAGPRLDGTVSPPLISDTLERMFLFVAHGSFPTGTYEYHQLSLGNPPVEREGGDSDLAWQLGGPAAIFADGRRVLTVGGGVVEISTTAPPREVGELPAGVVGAFQHNPAIERAAFLDQPPAVGQWTLAIVDTRSYDAVSSEDISAWAEGSRVFVFPYRDGFLLLKTLGEDVLHSLYVVPD